MKIENNSTLVKKIGFAKPGEIWILAGGCDYFLILKKLGDKVIPYVDGWREDVPVASLIDGDTCKINGSTQGIHYRSAKVVIGG